MDIATCLIATVFTVNGVYSGVYDVTIESQMYLCAEAYRSAFDAVIQYDGTTLFCINQNALINLDSPDNPELASVQ